MIVVVQYQVEGKDVEIVDVLRVKNAEYAYKLKAHADDPKLSLIVEELILRRKAERQEYKTVKAEFIYG